MAVQGVLRGDPYDALGVPRNASPKMVKKAHRKLARANHPDRNPGNPKADHRFKEISEAYEMITGKVTKRAPTHDRGTFGASRATEQTGQAGGFQGGGIFGGCGPSASDFRIGREDL
jgi:molecular chaperone DnaJ